MKTSILMVALMVLAGCAETLDVTSYRSLIYSRERFAKRGSVCVMTDPRTSNASPQEDELADTRIVADGFKRKGFSISEEARDAQYGFTFMSLSTGAATGFSVKGTFYELAPEGEPGRVLWDARVAGPVDPSEWSERRRAFLKAMLKQFPD